MKKTQLIEVLHNFSKQFVTFISIVLFVGFAIGSFLGLTWSGESIGITVDEYFNEGNFFDYEISYVYGIDDSDIDFIKSLEDFDEVEPRYISYDFNLKGNDRYQLRVESLGEEINKSTAIDGHLPENNREMVIDQVFAEISGYKIGDTITIDSTASQEEIFATYFKNQNFNFDNFYQMLENDEIVLSHLKEEEFTITGIIKTSEYISSYADTYGVNPINGYQVNGMVYINQDAFNQDAFMGYSSLMVKSNKLRNMNCFDKNYKEKFNSITNSNKDIIENHFHDKYIDYINNMQSFVNDSSDMIDEISLRITEVGSLSFEGFKLSIKLSILTAMQGACEELISNNFEYKSSINGRSSNASFCAIETIINIFSELRFSLCALFVIVGTLVCYFAVSRNVYDQTKLLGTKKALGMTRKEILTSLCLFSAVSTIFGIIIGAIASRFLVETILVNALSESYRYNTTIYIFHIGHVILFAVIELVLIIGSTYLASRSILRRSANELLVGVENNDFKESPYMKTKIYRKSSLLAKTIFNNLFHDKRRVFSTIVGIMGITSLIVSSISLNNFIQGSFDNQLECVSFYDTIVFEDSSDNQNIEIKEYLNNKDVVYSEIMSTYVIMNTPDNQHLATSIYVIDNSDEFLKLFKLSNSEKNVESIHGYYSSMAYKEEYKVDDGAIISLTDMEGQDHNVVINTFFNYYLVQGQFIVDRETYVSDFNQEYVPNAIIMNRDDISIETLKEDLLEYSGYVNIFDFYSESRKSFDSFASVFSIVVGLYIFLAILMAFIVVNNLLSMFINEKKNELTILMINGFYRKQAKRYIYFDTIILTIIGIILGLVLGVIIGNLSLEAYKSATIYMLSGIDWMAIICGVTITSALTLIVTLVNLIKVNKFKLGDISK